MPASRPKWMKALGVFPKYSRPDADKLLRAVGDALEASGLVYDDAQFTSGTWDKLEVADDWTGAEIRISSVPVERPVKGAPSVQPGLLEPLGDTP